MIENLLQQLTLEEKCAMLHGRGIWEVAGCERLAIPEWTLSDGPVGVRGRKMAKGLMMPAPIAMAASWDVALLAASGEAIGEEARDRKVQVLLAPTVNLHRVPTSGRTFECYSEDPHLSARMAVAFIQAVQAQGVGACIKHFVANEQETDRFIISSEVDERTLRELYFVPFEAAIKEADVKAVMGSYNLVCGTQACANRWLLTDVLRDEWGFSGFVVTDWSALHSAVEPILAGIDLEMPTGGYWADGKLAELVKSRDTTEAALDETALDEIALTETVIDERLGNILRFLDWAERLQGETDHEETVVERPSHTDLARKAAAAGTVLVHNRKGLLPLLPGKGTQSIALLGPGSQRPCPGGGGSAELGLRDSPDLPTALREHLGKGVTINQLPCLSLDRNASALPQQWLSSEGATLEFYAGRSISGEPALIQTNAPVPVMLFGGNWPVKDSYYLSMRQRLSITPDVSGPWRLCGAGMSDVRLFADGQLVSDNRSDAFSLGPGLYAAEGIVNLTAGQPCELVLEHTSERQHLRFIVSDIRAAPVLDSAESEADMQAGVKAATDADVAVVVVGSTAHWETENFDRSTLELPLHQDELVRRVIAANPNTVVVVNSGAPMLLPWLDEAAAVLVNWYPGQEGAAALADVLVGAAEPAGRMPVTWPYRFEDTPAGANTPSTHPGIDGKVFYSEGVLIGHRWLDANNIDPAVPFGHGGSYTSFEWGEPELAGEFPKLTVKVNVRNTGTRSGSEVVQCYLSHGYLSHSDLSQIAESPNSGASPLHPPQWLAGFTKLQLSPGETTTAEIPLNFRSFAHWNTNNHDWSIAPGTYQIHLARSSRDVAFILETQAT